MKSIKTLYKIGYGPSSSHTMGPEQACLLAKKKYNNIKDINVTLYGSLKDGNRPSFTKALKYVDAKELYSYFFAKLHSLFPRSYDGLFGADMQVSLTNDGPSTYILDSEENR